MSSVPATDKPFSRSYLTDRFFMLFGFTQLLGVLALLMPWLFIVYLLTWPLWIVALLVDRASLVAAENFSAAFKIARSPEIAQSTPVAVRIQTEDPKALRLSRVFLVAPVLKTLHFDQDRYPLRPEVDYDKIIYQPVVTATAQSLGYEKLSLVTLQTYSRWGLFFREAAIPATEAEFRVVPNQKKISEQAFREIVREQSLFYQGNRKIVRSQAPEQFYSIREYQYPDSIRHIDARKSAKYSQLMTRTYDSLLEHHLILGLDVGRSMYGRMGPSRKLDYYLSACLALAENACHSRDRLSFFAFSQKVHFSVRRSRHMADFRPLFTGHPALRAREEESNFDLIHPTLSSLSGQRSIVLLFTDISRPSAQTELLKSLQPVLNKHLVVLVGLLDEEYLLERKVLSLDPNNLAAADYRQLLYTYWLNENIQVFKNRIAASGGGLLLISEREWLSAVQKVYLLLRESMRI